MAPRRRCPVCRSKQWHKEPSSGLIACSEGHILQNYRNETTEVEEVGPHLLKKRTLKSNRQKKAHTGRGNPKLYHGNRGRYFYFQCLQLILRHQVAVLIERWALPAEFEVVCRDLWALHLSLLRNGLPTEPDLAAHESDESPEAENPTASTPDGKTESPPPGFEDPKAAASSDGETDGDDAEHDPELDELLAENSASESSSEGEDEVDPKPMPPAAKSKHSGRHKYEQPANTLAVIVLACWTLRIPILYRDLTRQVAGFSYARVKLTGCVCRLIESYELPYLEATRLLPQEMMVHLTKNNIQALCPPHTPRAFVLHNLASSLARRIYSTFGVSMPQANAAPILWRVVNQCLGGTPTLYKLTKRLSSVLELPLVLHQSLAPRLRRNKARDPEFHQYDSIAPELAFLATAIVVLKMVYGLDGKPRLPADPEDPACNMPRIDEYLELLRRLEGADAESRDAAFDSRKAMVIEDLSDDTVDEYLGFCERALIGGANGKRLLLGFLRWLTDGAADTDILERYFPLRASKGAQPEISLTRETRELQATELQQDGDKELQPGMEYPVWHSDEMAGEYAAVVGRGARWVGVGTEYVDAVVGHYERRVWRWWRECIGPGVMSD
ncbi:hypothetical protein B0H15DRAFT_775984 [Mycena belliarum]|uniref:RRN7-type domain-containing protein n=1 Tax=Mycena belliarum TaxID=1033014 RepID=A0AAD6U9L1_9AGAR|nr:hypothetical protein B0H15DRAFT_775984 [Mycena belliae]